MKSVKMKLNSPGIKYAGQKQTAKRNGYADGAGQRAKEGRIKIEKVTGTAGVD
jgi:hypothetical protein